MSVVFKGGTSGNREDHAAPTPLTGKSQPVLTTETHGAVPSNIHFDSDHTETASFMPTGATIQGPQATSDPSTDLMDPDATTGGAA